jgi:hypothetical protein
MVVSPGSELNVFNFKIHPNLELASIIFERVHIFQSTGGLASFFHALARRWLRLHLQSV